jgi:iron complex transport system substrate-binding protein
MLNAVIAIITALTAFLSTLPAQAQPQRIVSLNLCADQLVLALADRSRIVALSPFSTDPAMSYLAPQADGVPQVRGGAEAVLGLSPDLVLVGSIDRATTARLIAARGIRVVTMDVAADLDQALAQVRTVAAALGEQARGEALAGLVEQARARLSQARARPVVALAVERRGYAAGPASLTGALLKEAGYLPPAGGPYGHGGFLGLEQIVRLAPSVLITDTPAGLDDQGAAFLRHRALIDLYPLVGRVQLPQALTLCAGPSLIAALEQLGTARGRK